MCDCSEAEQRKRDKVQRKAIKTETAPTTKATPVWVYAAVGVGVIITVLIILYVAGALN